MSRVLIVDDDQGLVSLLQRFLQNEGFQVHSVFDHRSGLDAALTGEYDVIILDVMLPGGSGFELLKSLRAQSRVPVILLTARGEAVDRILGLEIGADDYVPKPFDPRELVARIRAVLRRSLEIHNDDSARRILDRRRYLALPALPHRPVQRRCRRVDRRRVQHARTAAAPRRNGGDPRGTGPGRARPSAQRL